jgi:hypothetical protein
MIIVLHIVFTIMTRVKEMIRKDIDAREQVKHEIELIKQRISKRNATKFGTPENSTISSIIEKFEKAFIDQKEERERVFRIDELPFVVHSWREIDPLQM